MTSMGTSPMWRRHLLGCTAAVMAMVSAVVAPAPAAAGNLVPPDCERRLNDLYETGGPATLGRLGNRYVLTVHCRGVHRIYVRVPSPVNLEAFVGKRVRARYRYVDQQNPATRCVGAPCPPAIERVVDITDLQEVAGASGPGG